MRNPVASKARNVLSPDFVRICFQNKVKYKPGLMSRDPVSGDRQTICIRDLKPTTVLTGINSPE